MLVISEDHYIVDVACASGNRTYTLDRTGSRYVSVVSSDARTRSTPPT
jgi:hypothetical protein